MHKWNDRPISCQGSSRRLGSSRCIATVVLFTGLLAGFEAAAQQLLVKQSDAQCKAAGGYITTYTSSRPCQAGERSVPGVNNCSVGPPVGECYVPPQITSSPPRSYTSPSNNYNGGMSGGGGNRFLNGLSGLLGAGSAILQMQAEREARAQAEHQAAFQRANFLNEAGIQHEKAGEWTAAMRAFEAAADALPADDLDNTKTARDNAARMRKKAAEDGVLQREAALRASVVSNLPAANPFQSSLVVVPDRTFAGGTVPSETATEIHQACRTSSNPSMCELLGMVKASQETRSTVDQPFNCDRAGGQWSGDIVQGFCQLPGQPARAYSAPGKAQEFSAILKNDYARWTQAKQANAPAAADRIALEIQRSLAMIMLSTATMDRAAALQLIREVVPMAQQVAGYVPPADRFALPARNPF